MIKIITDSTCDIDAELLEQYDIAVVPCYIIWGKEQYLDRVTMTPQEFY
jgi:fatty acid-binding protein DegV